MSIELLETAATESSEGPDSSTSQLPQTRTLIASYVLSLAIAALTAVAAVAGLLRPNTFYPTPELQHSYLANDVLTLCIGLPALLACLWLARRGRLIGLLFWPGAILYGLYNYIAYLFGMPFAGLFPLYLLIVTLSLYATIILVASIDGKAVKKRLNGRVPERLGGGVLVVLGVAYLLLASIMLINHMTGPASPDQSELAVFVADFFIAPAWVIGGLLLWQRRPLGYVGGAALLFSASMLFAGVIGLVSLRAIVSGMPLPVADLVALLAMGAICFLPTGMFIRGIIRS